MDVRAQAAVLADDITAQQVDCQRQAKAELAREMGLRPSCEAMRSVHLGSFAAYVGGRSSFGRSSFGSNSSRSSGAPLQQQQQQP